MISARNAEPRILPLSPLTPDGRSTAITGALGLGAFLDRRRGLALDRLRQAGAEQRVDDHRTSMPARNQPEGFASTGHSAAAIAASVPGFGSPSAQTRTDSAGLVQQLRHDIAVAAIVAGAAEHMHRRQPPDSVPARPPPPPHRRGASDPCRRTARPRSSAGRPRPFLRASTAHASSVSGRVGSCRCGSTNGANCGIARTRQARLRLPNQANLHTN